MTSSTAPLVFDYLDFRAFLRDFYFYKKQCDKSFSYRKFGAKAGFSSPNYLKLVVDGKRNLSEDMAQRFAQGCELSPEACNYFVQLVYFCQAEDPVAKEQAFQSLTSARHVRGIQRLERAQFAYFSQWYLPAIRELGRREDFRADATWIAAELVPSISEEEARFALRTLCELDLLKPDANGELRPTDALVSTGDETRSMMIAAYHRELMHRASASIDLLPPDQRELSALTLCLGPEGLSLLKRRIQSLRQELLERESMETHPTQVLQLNFQMFPLSRGTPIGETPEGNTKTTPAKVRKRGRSKKA